MRVVFLGLLVFAGVRAAEPPAFIAIRNARVVTVAGPVIERGAVVVQNGFITDVGASVSVPPGAWVVEGEGLTVYPGLIDALSTWGLIEGAVLASPTGGRAATPAPAPSPSLPSGPPSRGPEDRPATTSWLKAADQVQIADRRLEQARNAGFTTAVSFPHRGIIAGHGAALSLAGETAGQMVMSPDAGLYLTLSTSGQFGSFPGSLMGSIAYIRQVWLDAAHYRQAKDLYARNTPGLVRPNYDRALEGVLDARRILLPATSRVEIERMIRFAAELHTPAVLYGLHQGYRSAEVLKTAGLPVIVSAKWPVKARDADPEEEETLRTLETRDKAQSTPAALAGAGVKFAFSSDGLESPREFVRAVKKSIDAGLKPEDAIRALTLSAAEIYGIAQRTGSIEKGKVANLTIIAGDLFDDRSQVRMLFIDGRKYLPTPETPPPPGGVPPSGRLSGGSTGEVRQ